MIVSRLKNDDWSFGHGLADYIKDEEAIYQNVKTRLRSFKNDWYLDTQAHIDWVTLLGTRHNKQAILLEIERVVLNTLGVTKITLLDSNIKENRELQIRVKFVTIYDNELELSEVINE